MKKIYLHGGPGLKDYMPSFFKQSNQDIFFEQKNPVKKMGELTTQLHQQLSELSDFAIIAHSFGGVVTLDYLQQPQSRKPKALILMGVPIYSGCQKDFEEECRKRNLIQPGFEDIFLSRKEKQEAYCRETLSSIFSGFNPESLQNLDSYMTTFDFRDFFKQTKIPTLVIYGADDVRVPAFSQRQYGLNNPHFQHFEIPEAGHFVFMQKENSLKVKNKIHNFLKTI